jgi:hypothetical protein
VVAANDPTIRKKSQGRRELYLFYIVRRGHLVFDMIYEEGGAIFSDCRTYRFLLWRAWDENTPKVLFVGLNPSVAGACDDDKTVNRCISFAKCAGYGGLYLVNLFAFISTPVAGLLAASSPEGNPDNDQYIHRAAKRCTGVIVAWGEDGFHRGRDAAVSALLSLHFAQLHCLAKATTGGRTYPRHPSRLSKTCAPRPFP